MSLTYMSLVKIFMSNSELETFGFVDIFSIHTEE